MRLTGKLIACAIMLLPGLSGMAQNVLFIAVDDLRAAQLGCYGDKVAITPNIDRLAKKGMLFTRAYCQQAVCGPSRASVLTGRRPDATKVWDLAINFRKALPNAVTLPQYFKQNGYFAQCVGKIYHDPADAQDPLSWSAKEILAVTDDAGGKYALPGNINKTGSWKAGATERADVPDTSYIDGRVAGAAVNELRKLRDRPFFLAVGFRRPHLPFSAPEKYWAMYDGKSLPEPAPAQSPINAPEIALHNWVELRGYKDMPKKGPLSDEKKQQLLHGYYAATSYTDAQIGKVLAELDRLGLREKTIIVLWSDHGYHLGEQNLWGKTTNFELDTRVPLIISAPGKTRKGSRSPALVELVDLYSTLADLAGLPAPEGIDGKSLAPLLKKPERSWKKAAFSQFLRPAGYLPGSPETMGYSVRTTDHRYTEWRKVDDGTVIARELYDHRTDPREAVNVAAQSNYLKTVTEMSTLLTPAPQTVFNWRELTALPDRFGFAGSFAGVSNGALLLAGGANFSDGGAPWTGSKKVWSDKVFVLDKPSGSWKLAGKLPLPLGYGVSVTQGNRLICIGGSNEDGHTAKVLAITYRDGTLEFENLPDLPRPLANSSGALLGNIVYIAGGIFTPDATTAAGAFWSLDLSAKPAAWKELPTWPGPPRMLAVAGIQQGSFFLFSGASLHPGANGAAARDYLKDAYRFNPTTGWQRVADMPRSSVAAATPAYASGSSNLVVFGGDDGLLAAESASLKEKHPGFSPEILNYNLETGTWTVTGQMRTLRREDAATNPNASIWAPVTLPFVLWGDVLVFPSGEVRPAVRTPKILIAHRENN